MSKKDEGYMGNCYAATEALYHILGGRFSEWKPMRIPGIPGVPNSSHWFLKHKSGLRIDPSIKQFGKKQIPYNLAKGASFLTTKPSKRAAELIEALTWRKK